MLELVDTRCCWSGLWIASPREGPPETLQVVDRFAKASVRVVSIQENWTEAAGELRDLPLAMKWRLPRSRAGPISRRR